MCGEVDIHENAWMISDISFCFHIFDFMTIEYVSLCTAVQVFRFFHFEHINSEMMKRRIYKYVWDCWIYWEERHANRID